MIQTTTGLADALREQPVEVKLCLDRADGTALAWDLLTSLTYTAAVNSGESLSLGCTCAAQIRFTYQQQGLALENRKLYLFLGAEVEGAMQWLPFGVFRVTATEQSNNGVVVTACDAMAVEMEQVYLPTTQSKRTVGAILREVAQQAGLGVATLPGVASRIQVGAAGGHTCREMVGLLAALCGCNAVMDREGQLSLRWYTPSGVTVTGEEYYTDGFQQNDTAFTLETLRVTVTTESQQTDEYGQVIQTQTSQVLTPTGVNGEVGIEIADVYMTQEVLDEVWAAIGGLSYWPGTYTFLGNLLLEPGDLITVAALDGTAYQVPVMEVEHTLDGGVKTEVTAVGRSKTESSISTGSSLTKSVERLEGQLAQFQSLYSQNLSAQTAKIERLTADYIESHYIAADEMDAVNAQITGYLCAVQIVGDLIRAGTISADKILLTSEDGSGVLFALNELSGQIDQTKLSPEQVKEQTLDGSIITAKTITAEKISVSDLHALSATIGGLTIGQNAIFMMNRVVEDAGSGSDVVGGEDEEPILDDGNIHVSMDEDEIYQSPAEDGTYNILSSNCSGENSAFLAVAAPTAQRVSEAKAYLLHDGRAKFASVISQGNIASYGDVAIEKSEALSVQCKVRNSLRAGSLDMSKAGNFGLWDTTNQEWVLYSNTGKNVLIPHPTYVEGTRVPTVISGTTANVTVEAEDTKDLSISFGHTFSSPPVVQITPMWNTTSTNAHWLQFTVVSRTTTGCTLRMLNGYSAAFSPAVMWTAIGT